jgi:D-amino-acid dehydrogenase
MKVVILGAGVVGVATAYALAKKGCQVTIVDRGVEPGRGSSFANGGQLSYNYRTPIANPKILKQLPKILLGFDPAFKIYPSLDFNFYKWGIRYLQSCLPGASKSSASIMRELGALARERMAALVNEVNVDFDYRGNAGKLYVYESIADLEQAAVDKNVVVWSRDELINHLPSFRSNSKVMGGVYDYNEDAADSYQFCSKVLGFLESNYDVTFLPETAIESIDRSNGVVQSIKTSKGLVGGDCFVVAMGPQSAIFAKSIGIDLPIYPMKGYSVTVPATNMCPDISVTDTTTKTVYCRLGNRLRIAGFAEFSGYDTKIKQERIEKLLSNARHFLPNAGDYDEIVDQWCGLRPVTPDSIPIVGRSIYSNLYLNVGHGMLGWTYSTATADVVSKMILKESQSIDVSGLFLDRF